VVTQTIAYEGVGRWREYAGGYQDWADYQAKRRAGDADVAPVKQVSASAAQTENQPKTRSDGARKLSYKDQRELDALPGRIEALEAEQGEIRSALADGSLYSSDLQKAISLQQRDVAIEEELMQALERWELLSSTQSSS
jgi:ATP-binding cassette subfamily F protein uup